MSQGEKVGLSTARAIAERLRSTLSPACTRIEIAGSVRREKPLVGDIEMVAIPLVESVSAGDLWDTPTDVDRLEELLLSLRASGALPLRRVENHRADGSIDVGRRDGAAYKALEFQGLPVDLFIVRDPDQWGTIFALRTGPGDWNTRLVTDCKRFLRRVEGGNVYRAGQRVPCPEERDFFDAIGQAWVEPRDRRVDRVEIRAEVAA